MKKYLLWLLLCVVAIPVVAQDEIDMSIDVDSIVRSYWRPELLPRQDAVDEVAVEEAVVETPDSVAEVKYIQMDIPDSMEAQVRALLSGHHKVVRDDSDVDLDEVVVFKGDTLPMVLKDLKLGRHDRGLYNFLFMPKGTWTFGLTASYGKFSTEDLQMFDVLTDVDFGIHGFSIRPYFSYAFKNNITAGLRLEYSNIVGNIDNFGLDIDEDMSFNISDVMYGNESYAAALLLTQYIGLTRKGRFGVFNEAQLKFSGGSSDFNRPYNGEMRATHSNNFEASLTYSPGVCVFVMPNVSINLSFGVFGFHITHTQQWEDGVRAGSRTTSGANFRFNIFNISLGLAVHL